jgi:hypothetical protein
VTAAAASDFVTIVTHRHDHRRLRSTPAHPVTHSHINYTRPFRPAHDAKCGCPY